MSENPQEKQAEMEPQRTEQHEAQAAPTEFESACMTRRQALRRIGLTTGIALFTLTSADDLARMAVAKLKTHHETRGIADKVARELRSAGVAFAGTTDLITQLFSLTAKIVVMPRCLEFYNRSLAMDHRQ